jgi:hypothetical protein
MKKIYLPVLLCLCLFEVSPISLKAQNGCPTNNPLAVAQTVSGNCVVYGVRLLPDTMYFLFDENVVKIDSAVTDASGMASFVYPCGKSPYFVSVCNSNACCNVMVTFPERSTLPIKLTNFNAQLLSNNAVSLKWTSSVELGSFTYIVQRSNDGKNFSDIGKLAAAGNSYKAVEYNFTENNYNSEASYFRLKQVDIDGRFEYSKVLYVNNKKTLNLVTAVAPNPFTTDVQLIGISSTEINYDNIRVFNSFGQSVPYHISGSNSIAMNANAPRGVYILKIKNQTFKLLKR